MKNELRNATKPDAPFSSERSKEINDEIERLKAEEMETRIREQSPDGRPAHPNVRAKEILILGAGSIFAVLAVSAATYALWGLDEALLVLGLGVALAFAGNPVIWAMFFRSKEREQLNHDREDHVPLHSNHNPRTH
jgi:hypothetical protein